MGRAHLVAEYMREEGIEGALVLQCRCHTELVDALNDHIELCMMNVRHQREFSAGTLSHLELGVRAWGLG